MARASSSCAKAAAGSSRPRSTTRCSTIPTIARCWRSSCRRISPPRRSDAALGCRQQGAGDMERRKLGALEVSAIGLGCMSMTPIYGEPDPAEAIATLHRAAELGIDFIDTSDAYGQGRNEELVGRAIAGRRGKYVVTTKFGNLRKPDGTPAVDG